MSADARVAELKLQLPPAPKPAGVYCPVVIAGNIAYVSGHGPSLPDGAMICGKVGDDLTEEQGKHAAARWVSPSWPRSRLNSARWTASAAF